MTARRRVLAAARGLAVDRPVAAPYMGNSAIAWAGFDVARCQQDSEAMAQAQYAAWRMFGQDVIVVQSDTYYMAEAFGAAVDHPDHAMPSLRHPLVTDHVSAMRLEPQDARHDGRMPVYIEAIKRLRDKVGESAAIRGCGTGPFVVAGHLLGIERLMVWLADTQAGIENHLPALDRIFTVALETLLDFASAQLEAGATIIQLADSLASLNMISPAMYRTYVLPYEREFFRRIRSLCDRYDALSLLHICGDNTAVFEDYATCGADIVAIDHSADFAVARDVVANRCCLIGNVDPCGDLMSGSPAQVSSRIISCLDIMNGRRYLVGTGCEVSILTPPENMRAFIETVHAYGRDPS